MSLREVATTDLKDWTDPAELVNGYTEFGMAMADYRGQLYGIMTQTVQYPNMLFANKFKHANWHDSWRTLPERMKAKGQVSLAVFEDRLYMARRGTNNKTYLDYTTDLVNWTDLGQVGSNYASTIVSPAMCAFDGALYIFGVGPDKTVYYTVVAKDGSRLQSWKAVKGNETEYQIGLRVYNAKLYYTHTGLDKKAFYVRSLASAGSDLSDSTKISTSVTSGVSMSVFKNNELALTYKDSDNKIKYTAFDGSDWKHATDIPTRYACAETGLANWDGYLHLSYSEAKKSSSTNAKFVIDNNAWDSDEDIVNEKHMANAAYKKQQSQKGGKRWYQRLGCF